MRKTNEIIKEGHWKEGIDLEVWNKDKYDEKKIVRIFYVGASGIAISADCHYDFARLPAVEKKSSIDAMVRLCELNDFLEGDGHVFFKKKDSDVIFNYAMFNTSHNLDDCIFSIKYDTEATENIDIFADFNTFIPHIGGA